MFGLIFIKNITAVPLTRRSRAGGNPVEYEIIIINILLDSRLRGYDELDFMLNIFASPFDNNSLRKVLLMLRGQQ